MNMERALSAVPEPPEASCDPEEVTVDEVADDPGEGVEVLLLCSLLYARGPAVRRVIDALTAADFHSAIHSALFEAISELVQAGTPHDADMVLNHLRRQGKVGGHKGSQLAQALTTATVAGAPAEAAEAYAEAVLAQAYRRGFRAAAQTLALIAAEAPEAQLYEQMCVLGRERRDATERLAAFRDGGLEP